MRTALALMLGLLVPCVAAAADCSMDDKAQRLVEVTWKPPAGSPVAGLVVAVDYPKAKVALPGEAGDEAVRTHVIDATSDAMMSPNDRGDQVKIAFLKSEGLPKGHLVTLDFRDCAGAGAPVSEDFRCAVIDSSDPSGNPVPGVTCEVVLR